MSVKNLGKEELREALVPREADDHKGIFGHVLVAAGSRGMAGAAILAARGALRSGAGLVSVAVPSGVAPTVAGAVPSAMILALPENSTGAFRAEGVDRLKEYVKERRVTTLAIGPGLTTHADAARFVLLTLSSLPIAAVVDADALNNLAQQEIEGVVQMLKARKQPCVFTPHPAEAARLLGMKKTEVEAQRQRCVEKLTRSLGGVVLLKGRKTLISSGARTVANNTGGPGLAKAGSGDVLTGLIAAAIGALPPAVGLGFGAPPLLFGVVMGVLGAMFSVFRVMVTASNVHVHFGWSKRKIPFAAIRSIRAVTLEGVRQGKVSIGLDGVVRTWVGTSPSGRGVEIAYQEDGARKHVIKIGSEEADRFVATVERARAASTSVRVAEGESESARAAGEGEASGALDEESAAKRVVGA